MEVFKDIIGYEGLYQISNLGNVKSLPKKRFNGNHYINRKESIRKPIMSKKGYLSVGLYDNDYNLKLIKIHKLVAVAFLENPNNVAIATNNKPTQIYKTITFPNPKC
jgi:hypothetical protein